MPEDVKLFAILTGDLNPAMVDPTYSQSGLFREVIAHGMWSGSLISTVLGTQFPGPGTILIDQSLHFARPVTIGDSITITVTAKQKFDHNKHIIFDCVCTNQDGLQVVRGNAEVLAPEEKSRLQEVHMPEIRIDDKHERYIHLLERVKGLEPIPTAVAHPCDQESLKGPVMAFQAGIIEPILVGPENKIRAVAEEFGIDLTGIRIVNAAHSHDSAALAVSLVRTGDAEALMKGSLHTDELMGEVVARANGMRTSRRISHVFLMDVPTYHRPLLDHRRRDQHRTDTGRQGRHHPQRHRTGPHLGHPEPRWPFCRLSRRSTRKFSPLWTLLHFARWPTAARSRAASWMARWPSTMPFRSLLPRPRASSRPWPVMPKFSLYPISSPGT
jgi:phosphate acetyltransferase